MMRYIDGFAILDEDIDCVKAQFDVIVNYHEENGWSNFKIREVRPDYLELYGDFDVNDYFFFD